MNNSDIISIINAKYDISEDHDNKIDNDYELNVFSKITGIIGGSGTGKTVLLKKLFQTDNVVFSVSDDDCITTVLYNASNKLDIEEIFDVMFRCGLSSVPTWKQTYSTLSNGEKLRFEIAYKLLTCEHTFFIDEFTSMLDRQTAENLCINLNKLLDHYDKNLVFTSCHFDILDWIKVNEVYDTNLKKSFTLQMNRNENAMSWKSGVYRGICGEYLSTIII